MESTQTFLNLCKEFEQAVETRYGRHQSAYHTLMRMQEYRKYWPGIDVIREIRNLYQHNVVEVGGKEAMIVTQDTCDTLRGIIQMVENPPVIKDVYTRNLVSARREETIGTVIRRMQQSTFSHVPILDDRKHLVGVFSKTTLFQILMKGVPLEEILKTPLSDYDAETDIRFHQSESFGFTGLYVRQAEVQKRFGKVYENGKRLTALYVTEHGRPEEAVIGVVTPWDLMG